MSNLSTPPLAFLALGGLANPAIDLSGIGMAGCVSNTTLDVVLGPYPGIGGSVTIGLPIPNLASLIGVLLYAQGICHSPATSLGLATSNGTQLLLGR